MTAGSDASTLDQVRDRLVARRALLVTRTRRVADDLQRRHEPLAADAPDRAIQTQNDEPLQVIEEAALAELAAVDEALERLRSGKYGICKRCEKPIGAPRLEAIPHAVTCAECARAIE